MREKPTAPPIETVMKGGNPISLKWLEAFLRIISFGRWFNGK